MPKIKTKKTALKRVKITKSGKILRKQVNTGHLKRKWDNNKKHRKSLGGSVSNIGHIKIFRNLLKRHSKGI